MEIDKKILKDLGKDAAEGIKQIKKSIEDGAYNEVKLDWSTGKVLKGPSSGQGQPRSRGR